MQTKLVLNSGLMNYLIFDYTISYDMTWSLKTSLLFLIQNSFYRVGNLFLFQTAVNYQTGFTTLAFFLYFSSELRHKGKM